LEIHSATQGHGRRAGCDGDAVAEPETHCVNGIASYADKRRAYRKWVGGSTLHEPDNVDFCLSSNLLQPIVARKILNYLASDESSA
jgi:hypothetical protein